MASANIDEDGLGRARVCEPCRRSKVRCEQQDPTRPCKRCAKGWRVCIPASRSQAPSKPPPPHGQLKMLEDRVHQLIAICESNAPHTGDKRDREVTEEGIDRWDDEPFPPSSRRRGFPVRLGDQGPIRSFENGWVDSVVETGICQIVNGVEASRLFHHYCSDLAVTFPAVVFAPGVTDAQVRLSTPTVFLAAITAAAKVKCSIDIHARLRELLFHILEPCLMGATKYTLELLQAVVISGLWYTPVHRETVRLEELCHAASDIATLLRQGTPYWSGTETQHLEARRAWLASYYLGIMAAMRSSHPSPMPWDQYAEECVRMLTSSPLAQPSDSAFCYYVSLQKVAWDHSQRLASSPRPTPLQVQEVLQSFNQTNHAQEQRMSQMDEDGCTSIASVLYHTCRTCVYDAAVDFSNGMEENTDLHCLPSSSEGTCLSQSLQSTHDVISRFTSLMPRVIQSIPTVVLLQVMHSTVVMVTVLISVSKHCSLGCHVIRRHSMRVDQALDAMFEVMACWRSTWPATKWTHTLLHLRKRLRDSQEDLMRAQSLESGSRDPCWFKISPNITSPFSLSAWELSPPSSFSLLHKQTAIDHATRPLGPSQEALLPIDTQPPKDKDSNDPIEREDGTIGLTSGNDLNMTQFLTDSFPGGDLDAELNLLEAPFIIQ